MEQLTLTPEELVQIGFEEKTYTSGDTVYEIPLINSCFYYNPKGIVYRWYYKTIIGDNANHIHLDITQKTQLMLLLEVFRVPTFPSPPQNTQP